MSMKVSELSDWIKTLEKDDVVWIDEGGLNLETKDGAYLELGGKVEFNDEDDDPKGFWSK